MKISTDPKIFVLKGNSNKGKTCTLNLLYSILLNIGANLYQNKFKFLEGSTTDFRSVLDFNGRKIGFITQGDYSLKDENEENHNALVSHIEELKEYNPEIIVCALSTKNGIEKELKDKYDIYAEFDKTAASENNFMRLCANAKDALEILIQLSPEVFYNQQNTEQP